MCTCVRAYVRGCCSETLMTCACGFCLSRLFPQLGLGKEECSATPVLIPTMDRGPLAQVAAGGEHTVLLAADGRVYGSGLTSLGQLGPPQDLNILEEDGDSQCSDSQSEPDQLVLEVARLKCLAEFRVIQVAAGNSHTIALTEAGEPLAFGGNSHGQLGRRPDSHTPEEEPARVSGLGGTRIVQVCCVCQLCGPSCVWRACVRVYASVRGVCSCNTEAV